MIPFPTLPTDSLYKFLFVLGVIGMAASSFFWVTERRKFVEYSIKVDSLGYYDDIRYDSLKQVQDSLRANYTVDNKAKDSIKHIEGLIHSGKRFSRNDLITAINLMQRTIKRLRGEDKFFDKDNLSLRKETAYYNIIEAKTKYAVDKFSSSAFYFKATFIVSFLMVFLGSLFWYLNGQRWQDKLLRLQVKQAELENNKQDITDNTFRKRKNKTQIILPQKQFNTYTNLSDKKRTT